MSQHPILRRTFLRGVGTTMALPFLESLVPRSLRAATAAANPPVRMAWVYIPQGAYMPYWMPKAEKTTADYELSECQRRWWWRSRARRRRFSHRSAAEENRGR
jgi:hypothetical protein